MDIILSLIDKIYEAGANPERWCEALLAIADSTGSTDVTMGSQTPSQVQIAMTARTDPAYVRTYSEYYHARNPMQIASHTQPIGQARLDAMILDMDHFKTGEFFNDWCRPQGILTGGSINLAAAGGWRATVMFCGPRYYDSGTLKMLNAIAPHLTRAYQLNQALHSAHSLGDGGMAALDHIDKGAFVVDMNGHAHVANAVADRILGQGDGLFLQAGRLAATNPAESAAIDRALVQCERGTIEASGEALTITRSAGRSPLSLLCVPYPSSRWWPGFSQRLALVFVTDRDVRLKQQVARLRQRYGLTPAEAALAWEIARSGGRQSAAVSRGISVATARSQLTSIFDKTGVRSQTDLVRLLLDGETDRGPFNR